MNHPIAHRKMIRDRNDNQGVILIALLWILTILSVIALSFARETFVEVTAARNQRDLTDAYFIARAGIAAAIYQLYVKAATPQVTQIGAAAPEPDAIDLGRVTGKFGDGEYDIDVQAETGKINLSAAREDQLRGLVEVIGIPRPDADIIVDSILDWREAGNNVPRQNGAKDDYYLSLQPPYEVWKDNGRMKAVEELLLIRGVTPEYYYGLRQKADDGQIVERYGLSRYVTAYSVMGTSAQQIQINYAPLTVLLSIPGMPPETARAIYERRKTKPFTSADEITREITPNPGPGVLGVLTWVRPSVWTLTASAHRMDSKARRVIRAVVRINLGGRDKFTILNWNENVPNW